MAYLQSPLLHRLHQRLMPDYNRQATVYWWLLVVAGTLVLAYDLSVVRHLGGTAWLQIGVATLFATLVGWCPVRLPGTKQSFVAGEIFIFLLLLLQGPEAAALAAAVEAAVGAWRTSQRWTSRLVSPAVALLSMGLVGLLMQGVGLAWPGGLSGADALRSPGMRLAEQLNAPALLVLVLVLASLNFVVTSQLLAGVPRLKRGAPLLNLSDGLAGFGWVGLAWLGSATTATLMFVAYRNAGAAVLLAVLPVLILLIVALHFYFLQQESAAAGRVVSERAERDAQRHLAELQTSELRFHSAFTHAAIGMALLSLEGALLQANPALRQLLGLRDGQGLGGRFQDLIEPEFRANFNQLLNRHLYGHEQDHQRPRADASASAHPDTGASPTFQVELRCRGNPDAPALWALLHCGFFHDPQADAPRLILQLQDVSARRQAEAGLHRLAFHDSLTGLPNRRQFLDSLGHAVARHQTDERNAYAVLYIDFDRFKQVNDSLGHKTGDALLVQLARRIQENLRPADVVARLSGDEFAVLVPQLGDERDALQLAERLVDALRRPFRVDAHALYTSASIGLTFSRFGYETADDALHDADIAMYRAKAAGKARYALFDGQRTDASVAVPCMAQELRQALARGELSVAYQPLVALASGQLRGFEALVRWQHPRNGALSAASFVPLAEESGLITALSDFVLAQSCHQLALWQALGPAWSDLTMCVNLSGHELAGEVLPGRISRVLQASGVAPRHLVLELTEDAVMSHLASAADNLSALRAMGVQLSVDDFGTGYSSLSRLARLPIDSFKIDRRFVHELTSAHARSDLGLDSAVVRALVQMGGAMGKTVVAEGIETAQQADQLRRMDPRLLGQGFHLAQPLSAVDATAWLHARAPQVPVDQAQTSLH